MDGKYDKRGFRHLTNVLLLVTLMTTASGCSVHRALSGPAPVAVERVKVGESRDSIISVLGIPKVTETKDDVRTDMYEFTDGYSGALETRAILYIAGDFFTLGLAELLFWPIELAAGDGTKGRAVVKYGMNDVSKTVTITQADGSPWIYSGLAEMQRQQSAGEVASPVTK